MIYLNKNMKNRFGKSENNLFTEKEMEKKKSCSQIAGFNICRRKHKSRWPKWSLEEGNKNLKIFQCIPVLTSRDSTLMGWQQALH